MLMDGIFKTVTGEYQVGRLLGKGKSGYSYLARLEDEERVLKVMHDEPVPYYSFRDHKVKMEVSDYARLHELGIRVPLLMEYSVEGNYVVKQYNAGRLVSELVANGDVEAGIWQQIFAMARTLKAHDYNIDYFPSNFVFTPDGDLYYVDYELNPYDSTWDFENWGIYYWVNILGMREFLRTGDGRYINESGEKGTPLRKGLEERVEALIAQYGGAGESA